VEANAITWAFSSVTDSTLFQHSLWRSLLEISTERFENNLTKLIAEKEYFTKNWWNVYSSRSWPFRLLELVLKLIGPGFWIYVSSYNRELSLLTESKPFEGFRYGTWEEIQELATNEYVPSISTIDWRSKEQVLRLVNYYDTLNCVFGRIALNGIPFGTGIEVPELVYKDPRIPYLSDRLNDTRSLN
jgi:hypothetical protein